MYSKMYSKVAFFLTIIITTPVINGLPNIFCKPSFASMTKLINDSYFIVNERGNFWVVEDKSEVSTSSSRGQVSQLVTTVGKKVKQYFDTFDLTFMINFDEQCRIVDEQLFGLNVSMKYSAFDGEPRYTIFRESKWTDIAKIKYDDWGHDFLNTAKEKLYPNNRINAILNFKPNGMLISQGSNLSYVYCDANKWKLSPEIDPIEFKPPYSMNFGEIFGGLVDDQLGIVYLFQAEIGSSKHYTRKWFHKCLFTVKPKEPKVILNCTKQNYNWFCIPPTIFQKHRLTLSITGAIIFGLVLIVFIGFSIYYTIYKKEVHPPEPKTLVQNMNRIPVNAGRSQFNQSKGQSSFPKPILARERTFGKLKPTLKRIRTIDFGPQISL